MFEKVNDTTVRGEKGSPIPYATENVLVASEIFAASPIHKIQQNVHNPLTDEGRFIVKCIGLPSWSHAIWRGFLLWSLISPKSKYCMFFGNTGRWKRKNPFSIWQLHQAQELVDDYWVDYIEVSHKELGVLPEALVLKWLSGIMGYDNAYLLRNFKLRRKVF